ncbi:putative polyketide synthase [Colletotrichum asianum]
MNSKTIPNEPIAIIGSACHFAGDASSPSKLWELLRNPRDARREIPESRFSAKGFFHKNNSHHGRSNVMHSYLLEEDPKVFDAEFFGINPIEARAMDPQQRMLLETVYEAIESGGMTIEGLRGSDTAVYAGVMCGDYEAMLLRDLDEAPTYFAVGTSRAVLSNRISYFFDWHGASVTIDTACSSSLVAVHNAVQTLRSGDSHMAVACGSNLILGPEMFVVESKVKMLSPDGFGRMWDKDANGYARGDGVAAVVLKTLSAALADNDHIEGIIRETGLNQDGATAGLTMPSATAQRDLIRRTYAKAGLDLTVPGDRPQYFEAHGTGTPAGDPVEAEAISSAFFPDSPDIVKTTSASSPLYVGSIKTVLGHTEGTAGVAAILKATLALQNSTIPPNLLFNNLNPSVAPFYDNLEIVKTAQSWPQLASSQPRRASVNSFGFGGANAHAILESYQHPAERSGIVAGSGPFTPFTFSAASEEALRANLAAYLRHLDTHSDINPHDLAYTLRERRSVFPYRATFPAASISDLRTKIQTGLDEKETPLGIKTLTRLSAKSSKILGIFTGQGAQYARMGAALIEQSPYARRIIQELETHLAQLPAEDQPTWSLEKELLADPSTTRLDEAAISQPLCTAVQIMLVDLLRSGNVHFDAVLGHSSGEIAAAYAAGFLSARDAIYIAYYRGLHCKHAASPNGNIKGAMLAAGTSMEDALELCEDPDFDGRITIAASNSVSSVTISGDEDAIEELELILSDEKKFNRRLRVDQAYHSRHMAPCFDPYVDSLQRAGVKAKAPSSSRCTWYSSVHDGKPVELSADLSHIYWAQNMTRPVLFSQAITAAVSASSDAIFDVALEVGPHPALKGPAGQNIQDALQQAIPYHGSLSRGQDAVESFSTCLGFLWSRLGGSVSLQRCEIAMLAEHPQFRVLKGLPTYQWKHETQYWHESRRSRRIRLREEPFHPLLGDISPDSSLHTMRWKNILKPSEIPWLEGHQVQGQIVFPAAGYVSTALEAARSLAGDQSIRLIELEDFYIRQGFPFESYDAGVEVHVELSRISKSQSDFITAFFTYSAALGGEELSLVADGELKVFLGEASGSLLPQRKPTPPHLINVESTRLYNFMESLEYNFSGPFRSLIGLRRKLGRACCVAKRAMTPDSKVLLFHPVELDAAIQSVSLAYSYPGDEQLRILHMPTSIGKIRVNPAVLASHEQQENVAIDSTCNREDRSQPGAGFSGNFDISFDGPSNVAVQLDQVKFKPVRSAASDDRNVFYKTHFVPTVPDGDLAAGGIPVTQADTDLLWVLSRIAAFYLRRFDEDVPEDSPARSESPSCHYLNYARHMTDLLKKGDHKYGRKEWLTDTREDVVAEIESKGVADNSVVKIMRLVGETMPKVFRGETTMLEHFRTSGLLDEYYAHGFGTMQSSMWLSGIVKQLTDRRPHLNLLEIGAGTGGATKNILRTIGHSFGSYTFTDISSSFFENAAEAFEEWGNQMIFKVCDAENDPVQQGFVEGSYDVVIAYLVVHATAKLDETMRNLRKLLKPGGFLLIGEGSNEGPMQAGASFIFGPLSGWWRGVDEGRTLTPFINIPEWSDILKRTGFSGIDTMSPPLLLDTFGTILFVSQAVDDRVDLIRQPLSSAQDLLQEKQLILIGGQIGPVVRVSQEINNLLAPLFGNVRHFKALEDLDDSILEPNALILSLTELDFPVFKDISPTRWTAFRRLFEGEKTMLWITSGRLDHEPYTNMTVGFGRSAVHEEEDLRLQFLDIPDASKADPQAIAENLVRLAAKHLESGDVLHTMEPEIIMDGEGRQLVPRLRPIHDANDRLNSVQRPILHQVDVDNSPVELKWENEYFVRQLSRFETVFVSSQSGLIELKTTRAILSAVRTPIGHLFLAIGLDEDGTRYLTLVPSLTSVMQVAREAVVLYKFPGLTDEAVLTLAAAHLVSRAIIDPLFYGQKALTHNPSAALAKAISNQASQTGVEVIFTTDADDIVPIPSSWIRLPRYVGRSEIGRLIPSDIACFSALSHHESENERTIASVLSPHCRKESRKTIFSPNAIDSSRHPPAVLQQLLQKAIGYVQSQQYDHIDDLINLDSLTNGEAPENPLSIIDWPASTSVPARVTRFDVKPLFKGDRTYWICGLSGALGISLCDWMIDRGLKYLVLTSRNPRIEPAWIEDHARNGVTVKIISCDVTDEKALRAVHQTIVDTLPPIVGVLNGAMVLRDVSVRNMAFDQVTDVIRPKVLGSIHLDNIFHDVNLDFFVLLSSINCVIGNVGQANYAAANMGMCGVAANRRKRGLASTVINVGAVIGAGYITESDRQLDVTVAKMAMIHLSEDDFHQIFAEAIDAGNPDSPNGPEISTGLLDISPDAANIPKWYSNPMFAHFIVHQTTSNDGKKQQTKAASIQDRLQECQSDADVLRVIQESFSAQLRSILQISTPDDDLMVMRSVNLGLDSLVSVDIRSWFLKNFQVSIPVLKIMSNDSEMGTLAKIAAEGIPSNLIPQVARDGAVTPNDGNTSDTNTTIATPPTESSPEPTSPSTSITTPGSVSSDKADAPIQGIDWEAEMSPPFGIIPFPSINPPKKQPSVVLLTGSSGLLGHHLLNRLLEQPSITKIICVAIRRLSERLEKGRLPPASDRIVYYEGDLQLPRFGLTEEQETSIFWEVDAVIHNGSDTSHLKYYSAVKQTNVESTRYLVRKCLPRMIPIHYVSSVGVCLLYGQDEFPEVSATASGIKPSPDGTHGYMCGKWVCEGLLEKVNALYGLKVWIQRPSTIIRAGDDASVAEAEFDWVNALLHYSHRIKAVPKANHNKGAFDLVRVESVCSDIIRELLRAEPRQGNGVSYFNNVGDIVIPMDRMNEIGKHNGVEASYEVLSMEEWARRAIDSGLHPAVAALIETFDEPGEAHYPRLLKTRE